MNTDASQTGWGSHLEKLINSGEWTRQDADSHISILEMKAVLLAFTAFLLRVMDHYVFLMLDSSAVMTCLNKQRYHLSSSVWFGWTDHRMDEDSRRKDGIKIHHVKRNMIVNLLKSPESASDRVVS